MHYRNGRTAENGDIVLSLAAAPCINIGVLYGATPGDDYCNGSLAKLARPLDDTACLVDCLHIDDVWALLAEKGLDKRPPGK